MREKCRIQVVLLTAVAGLCLAGCGSVGESVGAAPEAAAATPDRAAVDKLIQSYPPRPQVAAKLMLAKYGPPKEAGPETLVWHNAGPYKRIMVTRAEIHHDFPKPHMDFLEHTINYRVPSNKATALVQYDGSVTLNRTAGEMSARCDLEGHNILTLNLAHDIVTGKTTVEGARKSFGSNVVDDMLGKRPAYVEALQFEPSSKGVADADTPVISGSPKRTIGEAAPSGNAGGDGEILGFVGAVHENEILAAAVAARKKTSQAVVDYATFLHKEHGMSLVKAMELGETINVAPLETAPVDQLRVKGAGELAGLVPLEGDAFANGYIAAMVKGHTDVLSMIDTQLLAKANNSALKQHLTEWRTHVAAHLERAKSIQAGKNP